MSERNIRIRSSITKFSLDVGLIPKICPVCKNGLPGGVLEEHHWGCEDQELAYTLGKSRRICKSCNQILGKLKGSYTGSYWSRRFRRHEKLLYTEGYTWEEQFTLLSVYFRSPRKKAKYPSFDSIEGEWSRFLPNESWLYIRLVRELIEIR